MSRLACLLVLWASTSLADELTPDAGVTAPVAHEAVPVRPAAPPHVAAPLTARQLRDATVGVGYFGLGSLESLTVLQTNPVLNVGTRTLVPMVGARWWFRASRLGLDVALGFMVTSTTNSNAGVAATAPVINVLGHVGLPVALVSGPNVIVLVAPELRAGFSSLLDTPGFYASGSMLELAVRGAVELFFGFIGVPALSLEASLRAGVTRDAQSLAVAAPLGVNVAASSETYHFGTSLSGEVATLVASTLTLKYYF